jgi:hypothetical protein
MGIVAHHCRRRHCGLFGLLCNSLRRCAQRDRADFRHRPSGSADRKVRRAHRARRASRAYQGLAGLPVPRASRAHRDLRVSRDRQDLRVSQDPGANRGRPAPRPMPAPRTPRAIPASADRRCASSADGPPTHANLTKPCSAPTASVRPARSPRRRSSFLPAARDASES